MHYLRDRVPAYSAALVALLISFSYLSPAIAHNTVGDYVKYLNPIPQKQKYLNQSQDRLIKKQKFNLADSSGNSASVKNLEQGLFAIVPADKLGQTDYVEHLLSNEQTNGVSVLIPWRTLEPTEEKYDWTSLDAILALCQKHDKSLILRISTCGVDLPGGAEGKVNSDTPSWVFENGAKPVKYLDKNKTAHLMPVLWDQTYLAAFSNFLNELGSRYDKNALIHSIGITGGGYRGGTAVLPSGIEEKGGDKTATNDSGFSTVEQIDNYLRTQQGMTQKKIVDHWKYVADLFPQAFPNTRLNFAINPPTPNRAGEDALDEISDYLLYRYGEHIYVTRQDLKNGKHGFDDYRVQLKFRPDTYAGISLSSGFEPAELGKLAKSALDDGISYVELPQDVLENSDAAAKQALDVLTKHLGYQIVTQKVTIPSEILQGEQLKAEFAFVNTGDTSPKRPVRELDKDVAGSYKVMIELKDQSGKPVAIILHTPVKKTEQWKTGEVETWAQSLKMPKLPSGQYEASVSLYDPVTERKLNLVDGRKSDKKEADKKEADKKESESDLYIGTLKIVSPATADKSIPN